IADERGKSATCFAVVVYSRPRQKSVAAYRVSEQRTLAERDREFSGRGGDELERAQPVKNASLLRKSRNLTGFRQFLDHGSHRCRAEDIPSRNLQVNAHKHRLSPPHTKPA